jgi:predicted Fe-S protein YdhL (DUF1289 family)
MGKGLRRDANGSYVDVVRRKLKEITRRKYNQNENRREVLSRAYQKEEKKERSLPTIATR